MPTLAQRDLQPELMDDPSLNADAHRQALRGLSRINRLSRVIPTLARRIERIAHERNLTQLHILDIATGAGDVPAGLARFAARHSHRWHITGADISPVALDVARQHAGQANSNRDGNGPSVAFIQRDALQQAWPEDVDIALASLFLHHLTREQCIELLQTMARHARHAVIISDLRRTRLGYLMASCGVHILSRSPIVHADGPQSVRAAWTIDEMRDIADEAGLANARIEPAWPQRFLLEWRRPA